MNEEANPAETWPYSADTPQRYSANYDHYLRLGGPVDLRHLVRGFTAENMNRYDMARFFSFCLMFDQIAKEGLAGDLAELGVYKGHTATLLAAMARRFGKIAYLLDTFEGFHPDDLKGVDAGSSAEKFRDTSLTAVRNLVGEESVRYVKGYFPDTASRLPDAGRYCLVHIDCDLYAPIRSALDYFYPRMVPGGFLVVHDYSSLCWNGAEKAVDEFFADKTEAPVLLPDSSGSVVVRKARATDGTDDWLLRKRADLLSTEWVSAANGGLHHLLGAGWGAPEDWGVWGVGNSHQLHLAVPPNLPDRIRLQAEVETVLKGSRTTQTVEVSACGTVLAVWDFTRNDNRRVREVTVPVSGVTALPGGHRSVDLLFAPRSTESPNRLAPDLHDDRPLGMALHRMRYLP